MTDSPDVQKKPITDLAETLAFLKASPGYIEGLSKENLRVQFNSLPKPIRRLIMNFSIKDWAEVNALMESLGVEDQSSWDSIRPLVERFRTLASKQYERTKARAEFRKEYGGVGAIKAQFLFEMSTGIPILHLKFLDEDEKVLFESRETTSGMMGNAIGIMVAVRQSFELCKERSLVLPSSQAVQIKEGLRALMGEVKRIAMALNVPESELIDAFSRSNSPERTKNEQVDVREEEEAPSC